MKTLKKKCIISIEMLFLLLLVMGLPVQAAAMKLNKTKATVYEGSAVLLTATVDGKERKVSWYSDNKSVATVKNGKVTGKKAGTATIKAKYGSLSAKCKITVKKSSKKAVAAYKKVLKKLTGSSFAVVDINGDGIYEVITERSREDEGFGYVEGTILYYQKGSVKQFRYGPSLMTFEAVNSKKQLVFGRTRGKAITAIYSFSPSKGCKEITSYFAPYLTEAEASRLTKKYMSGLKSPVFRPVNTSNLKKYLSGNGKATGLN